MPEIENENLNIENEEQADAALEAIEQSAGGPIADESPTPQAVDEFDITVGGKQIKAKRDQLIQWAQQGYSAPGQISKITKELEGWKKKWSEAEPKWNEMQTKYGPVDEYVRQNPQFWDHVTKSFEQRNQVLNDQSNPLAGMVTDLQQKVQDLIQYKNQVEERQQKHQSTQEDQEYLQTFEEIKKGYPDIDFVTPDDEGKSLEYRVLEFASEKGIKNFDIAFKAYKHDDLISRAETKAKESLAKEKQKNTKLGILGITPTPTKRADSGNVRSKSWDNIADEVRQELGIR